MTSVFSKRDYEFILRNLNYPTNKDEVDRYYKVRSELIAVINNWVE